MCLNYPGTVWPSEKCTQNSWSRSFYKVTKPICILLHAEEHCIKFYILKLLHKQYNYFYTGTSYEGEKVTTTTPVRSQYSQRSGLQMEVCDVGWQSNSPISLSKYWKETKEERKARNCVGKNKDYFGFFSVFQHKFPGSVVKTIIVKNAKLP